MSFRVYDKKKKKFIDNVVKDTQGDLYKVGNSLFGNKLTFLYEDRYVYQKSIDLFDKNNDLIYIGDYIKAEVDDNKLVVGMVHFSDELASYVILCFETGEYFTLGADKKELIEIVGNVFEEQKDGNRPQS